MGIGGVLIELGLKSFKFNPDLPVFLCQLMDVADHKPWSVHEFFTRNELSRHQCVINLEIVGILQKISRGGVSGYVFLTSIGALKSVQRSESIELALPQTEGRKACHSRVRRITSMRFGPWRSLPL